MFSRIICLLAILAATQAVRPIRQATKEAAIKWSMIPPSIAEEAELLLDPIDPKSDDESNILNVATRRLQPKWEFSCPNKFGYYRYEQSCDVYVECRNYRPYRKMCPDGMHFKENARWSEYPCGYPVEAPCRFRGGTQPAIPTEQCPHQFGFYPITDKSWPLYDRCSHYIVCDAGLATVMNCSIGLAFNPSIGSCDWPERVPECRDFLGFNCPIPAIGKEDLVLNYRYVADPQCRYFFSCHNGLSRVLSCEQGLAFDSISGKCIAEELVQCEPVPYDVTPNPLNSAFTFGYDSVPLI